MDASGNIGRREQGIFLGTLKAFPSKDRNRTERKNARVSESLKIILIRSIIVSGYFLSYRLLAARVAKYRCNLNRVDDRMIFKDSVLLIVENIQPTTSISIDKRGR